MTLREILLSFGLAASLVSNIVLMYERNSDQSCNNADRYSSKETIGCVEWDKEAAKVLISSYREKHCADAQYINTGFNISKRAIDQIFQNTTLNTISTDLIVSDNKLTIVFQGNKIDATAIKPQPSATNVFIVQSVCPYDCTVITAGTSSAH